MRHLFGLRSGFLDSFQRLKVLHVKRHCLWSNISGLSAACLCIYQDEHAGCLYPSGSSTSALRPCYHWDSSYQTPTPGEGKGQWMVQEIPGTNWDVPSAFQWQLEGFSVNGNPSPLFDEVQVRGIEPTEFSWSSCYCLHWIGIMLTSTHSCIIPMAQMFRNGEMVSVGGSFASMFLFVTVSLQAIGCRSEREIERDSVVKGFLAKACRHIHILRELRKPMHIYACCSFRPHIIYFHLIQLLF